ncbi:MAG: hypothetical protein ACTS8R_08820 [Arsenophonus sp. NC-QC1-MAG3]
MKNIEGNTIYRLTQLDIGISDYLFAR